MSFERTRAVASVLTILVLASPALAGGDDRAEQTSLRLEELGLRYDEARSLAGDEQQAAMRGIAEELDSILGKALPERRRGAGYFLAAEVRRQLDQP
jgi:hypothetical protein